MTQSTGQQGALGPPVSGPGGGTRSARLVGPALAAGDQKQRRRPAGVHRKLRTGHGSAHAWARSNERAEAHLVGAVAWLEEGCSVTGDERGGAGEGRSRRERCPGRGRGRSGALPAVKRRSGAVAGEPSGVERATDEATEGGRRELRRGRASATSGRSGRARHRSRGRGRGARGRRRRRALPSPALESRGVGEARWSRQGGGEAATVERRRATRSSGSSAWRRWERRAVQIESSEESRKGLRGRGRAAGSGDGVEEDQ